MKSGLFIRSMLAAAGAAIWLGASGQPAAACNKTAGCVMDVLLESHEMMEDGRMAQGMREGRENIEAFQRLQAAEQAARHAPARSKSK